MTPEQLSDFKQLKNTRTPEDFTRNFYLEPEFIVQADHTYKDTVIQTDLLQALIAYENINRSDNQAIFKAQCAVRKGTEELGISRCQHKDCNIPYNLHYPTIIIKFKNADLLTEQEIENVIEHWHTTNEHLFIKYNIFGAMVYGELQNKMNNENISFVSVN